MKDNNNEQGRRDFSAVNGQENLPQNTQIQAERTYTEETESGQAERIYAEETAQGQEERVYTEAAEQVQEERTYREPEREQSSRKGRQEKVQKQRSRAVSARKRSQKTHGRAGRSRGRGDSSRNAYALNIFFSRYARVIMPVVLLIAVLLTGVIAVGMRRAHKKEAAAAAASTAQQMDIVMEKNAHSDVNKLMKQYYDALADGDTDTISSLCSSLSDEEKIRIEAIADNIDSYSDITVYTKPGPVSGSYVAYVYTKMKFKDHDWEVPGMQTMYVCTRDDGSLYLNTDEEQDADVTDYIQKVSVADDVVDLNNTVTKEYNDLLNANPDLVTYLDEFSNSINVKVGEGLAALSGSGSTEDAAAGDTEAVAEGGTEAAEASTDDSSSDASSSESTDAGSSSSSESASDAGSSTQSESAASSSGVSNPTKATAKETVAVRKGAGTSAEQLGMLYPGDSVDVLSYDANGWSKISYKGQEGYVKSEFCTFK